LLESVGRKPCLTVESPFKTVNWPEERSCHNGFAT
jgi:hypothetical protein